MSRAPSILKLPDGNYITYHQSKGKENNPGVVFLGGFMSDMTGTKATALEIYCIEQGYPFVRFDYFGHGQSSGQFIDGTIGRWKENVLTVLDQLTTGPQILVGSSMGGWLMLLAAIERPERVAALVGIASAPDFTEKLIWQAMFPEEQAILLRDGVFQLKSDYGEAPYPISLQLIEEGRHHLLLEKKIPVYCPVSLIHGALDRDVPSSISVALKQQLLSEDVHLTLVEDGDHRMSTPENIELLCSTLESRMGRRN